MNKKIICAILSAASIFAAASAFAEVVPEVYVDGCKIMFTDQQPIIENDRILIPARGVMEATGAKVGWYPQTNKVQIQSHDSWRIAEFIIDSDTLRVGKIKEDLISMDVESFKLDVPPKIVNDRTMIPLRAINDAFKYQTEWDDETKTAYVTTDRTAPTSASNAEIYLTADKQGVKAGDTVNVFVNISGFEKETADAGQAITGATVGLIYDKTKLELASATMCNNDKDISGIGAMNADFAEDELKAVNVTVDEDACLKGDGAFYKITFTALADDCGTVALSTRYNTRLGYDTTFVLSKDSQTKMITPEDYYINTTPIEIK